MSEEIQKNAEDGSETGKNGSGSSSPTGKSSAAQGDSSKEHWLLPSNVKELAAQATKAATMLLNGTLDLETARAYSAIVRGVGQLIGAEVARSRSRREQPDLNLSQEKK